MRRYTLSFVLILIDIIVLIALFYLTLYVRTSLSDSSLPLFKTLQIQDFSFVIFVIFALLFYEKIYTLRYDFWQETRKIMKSLFYGYLIIMALLTLSKVSQEYSRLFISLYFMFALFILPVVKRLSKKVFYKIDFFIKKVYIVGEESQIEIFKKEFRENWYLGLRYSDSKYDTVIIASKGTDAKTMKRRVAKYLQNHTEVYIVPYVSSVNFANSNIMEYFNIRNSTIQVENKLLLQHNIWIKSVAEFFMTLLILPLFLTIHVLITILIRADSKGLVFFKQYRLGKNDNNFICYKYRTMYENSASLLESYLLAHPEEIAHYEEYHKYKNDPRITKIGKILRSTSLDELPQIINVLKAEMSLVGPRPYMTSESDKLGEHKEFVLKVKPGITGLWQVSGRNELTFKERNELDVWYINNWSLWADFVIMMKTIKVVLSKVGAR